MKIIEWNLHLAANKDRFIPPLVSCMLNELSPDIIVLNEYVHCINSTDFVNSLNQYNTFCSNNSQTNMGNEVLIALKKDILICSITDQMGNYPTEESPNFLQVEINYENKNYIIIGIRIKTCNYNYSQEERGEYKAKQYSSLFNYLNNLDNDKVFVTGDFNALDTYLNKTYLKDMNDYSIISPSNDYSYYFIDTKNKLASVKFDYNIVKNISNISAEYSWDYQSYNKEYFHNIYNSQNRRYCDKIPFGYPDHAILISHF